MFISLTVIPNLHYQHRIVLILCYEMVINVFVLLYILLGNSIVTVFNNAMVTTRKASKI